MAFWEEQVKRYSNDPEALDKELDRARRIIKAKRDAGLDTSEQTTYYNKMKAVGEGAGVEEVGDYTKNKEYGSAYGDRKVRTTVEGSTGDIYETERGDTQKIYSAPRDSNNYATKTDNTASDLIDKMYSSSRDSLVTRLRESYEQQREAVQNEMSKVAPAYKAAKGEVLTQGKQAGKRLNELMRNQASGDTAQEQLQRSTETQGAVSDLGLQEQQTMDEFGQTLGQLTREEQSKINAGLSELDAKEMGAKLDKYYKDRQFGLQQEELGLAKDQFDYSKYRDVVSDVRYDQEYNDEMAYREWKKDLTEDEFELKEDMWEFEKGQAENAEDRAQAEFNARMNALTQPSNKDEFAILADLDPKQLDYYNSVSGRLSSFGDPNEAYQYVIDNFEDIRAGMGDAAAELLYNKVTNFATGKNEPDPMMEFDDYKEILENDFKWTDALQRPDGDPGAIIEQINKWEKRGVDPAIISELRKVYGFDINLSNESEPDTGTDYDTPGDRLPSPYESVNNVGQLSDEETEVVNTLSKGIKDSGFKVTNDNMVKTMQQNKTYLIKVLGQDGYDRLVQMYQ